MDEEQREYNFPTEDSDDTKSPPEKSPEDARAAMQQSLQQFANGVAQSLAVTHEVAKIVDLTAPGSPPRSKGSGNICCR